VLWVDGEFGLDKFGLQTSPIRLRGSLQTSNSL